MDNVFVDWELIEKEQRDLCNKVKVVWEPVDIDLMLAVSNSIFTETQPVNGERHVAEGTLCGWFVWSGEEIPQNDEEFFSPIHLNHLIGKRLIILKYLGLPVGWRFQIDYAGYEDVWFDESIL